MLPKHIGGEKRRKEKKITVITSTQRYTCTKKSYWYNWRFITPWIW